MDRPATRKPAGAWLLFMVSAGAKLHVNAATPSMEVQVDPLMKTAGASNQPGDSASGGSSARLEETHWVLVTIEDKPVADAAGRAGPFLVLDSGSVSGLGGCNRFGGGYRLRGDSLTFGQLAATMMACMEGMETEAAFMRMLPEVRRWKIDKNRLEFFDTSGKRIAAFEARPDE